MASASGEPGLASSVSRAGSAGTASGTGPAASSAAGPALPDAAPARSGLAGSWSVCPAFFRSALPVSALSAPGVSASGMPAPGVSASGPSASGLSAPGEPASGMPAPALSASGVAGSGRAGAPAKAAAGGGQAAASGAPGGCHPAPDPHIQALAPTGGASAPLLRLGRQGLPWGPGRFSRGRQLDAGPAQSAGIAFAAGSELFFDPLPQVVAAPGDGKLRLVTHRLSGRSGRRAAGIVAPVFPPQGARGLSAGQYRGTGQHLRRWPGLGHAGRRRLAPAEYLRPVGQYPGRQDQRRCRTDPDGDVHHHQAAGEDAGHEEADRHSSQESAGSDHVRSPRAMRVMLPTEETLLGCVRLRSGLTGYRWSCGEPSDGWNPPCDTGSGAPA